MSFSDKILFYLNYFFFLFYLNYCHQMAMFVEFGKRAILINTKRYRRILNTIFLMVI